MPEKDLETIITEILANSGPTVGSRKHINPSDRGPANQYNSVTVRPRKGRPQRNPIYTSLRLILLGLVILLVPLLFSVKKVQPPKSMITGAFAPDQTVIAQMTDARLGQIR